MELSDRVNQLKATQQESHRSTTAMGVDATENITRLGNELERLKTRLSGMENSRSGREAEGIRADVNALSEKVQAAEADRERMERLETRVAELNHGFDLAEIQNQEWRDNTMKDFAEIPKMTPYYRKLLQDGKDLGPVLQHLSDRQDGQEARNDNTEARVGQLVRTVDAGFTENKQQLGRIQAYLLKKTQLTVGHKKTKRSCKNKWKDSGRLNCFWGLDWQWGQWWEWALLDIS